MQQYKFYTVLYRNYQEVNIGTLEQKKLIDCFYNGTNPFSDCFLTSLGLFFTHTLINNFESMYSSCLTSRFYFLIDQF